MASSFARNAIVLGLLAAVGPLATDMYLPALPGVAADLDATTAAVQASLMAFFLAVAVGQIVYGPVSDSFGRKSPLYFGMALYAIGSMGCSLAPTIEWLIALRFVQGLGACAGMTIPRAVARDLYTGSDAARLMALIMLVFSVAPILAPLFGSIVIAVAGWRVIFIAVGAFGIVGLVVTAFILVETRPAEKRIAIDIRSVLRGYRTLLGDRYYLGVVFVGGFGMSAFFSFLAGSSFVYIDHFGLTPTQYGLAFSVNAIAFIGSAQLTGRIGRRIGLQAMVRAASTFSAAVLLAVLAVTLAGLDNVAVLIVMLLPAFGGLGLVIPSTLALALENYGPTAGTAAALLGTLQLVTGAAVIAAVGLVSGGTVVPMVAAMAGCATVAFVIARLTLVRRGRLPAAAE
jgi:DHA1 family bicyclomycin/chloramphenicol resistance-like MFS transporter